MKKKGTELRCLILDLLGYTSFVVFIPTHTNMAFSQSFSSYLFIYCLLIYVNIKQ